MSLIGRKFNEFVEEKKQEAKDRNEFKKQVKKKTLDARRESYSKEAIKMAREEGKEIAQKKKKKKQILPTKSTSVADIFGTSKPIIQPKQQEISIKELF